MAVTHRARRLTEANASPRHLAEVLYRIRGLRMIGHVLHVGAHPDDEDAGLMAFVARKYGARMVYWSATRGEAGQNRIGSHSGDALGSSDVLDWMSNALLSVRMSPPANGCASMDGC